MHDLNADALPMRTLLVAPDRTSTHELYEQLSTLRRHGLCVSLEITRNICTGSLQKHKRYDAVLLDLDTTEGDETRLLTCLRETASEMPVFVFVHPQEEGRGAAAVIAGATDYILKGQCVGRSLARCMIHAIERTRLQSQLRQAEEDYHRMIESASTPMAIVTERGSISRINRHMEQLLGCSRYEIEGKKEWADFAANAEAQLETLRSWGREDARKPLEIKVQIAHRSSQVRSHRFRITRLHNRAVIAAGLPQLQSAEQPGPPIRDRAEYISALFESVPEGIVAFDSNGSIHDLNPAFEQLCNLTRDELLGAHVLDLLVPQSLRSHGERMLEALFSGESNTSQIRGRRSDGQPLVMSIFGAPIIVGGELVGGLCMCRDITATQETQELLEYAFIDLVETTLRAVESVDPYTAGHQRRVARLADIVGRKFGLDDERLQGLYVGSMLHDIGKLSLPSTILTKPGRLTREEWNLVKSHSRRGHAILSEASLPWPVMDMALGHHERLDGSGYPDGRAGDQLSLEVRILGVCDVVEAMTSDRPYRPALGTAQVLEELRDGCGSRYDERVIDEVLGAVENGEFQLELGYRNLV